MMTIAKVTMSRPRVCMKPLAWATRRANSFSFSLCRSLLFIALSYVAHSIRAGAQGSAMGNATRHSDCLRWTRWPTPRQPVSVYYTPASVAIVDYLLTGQILAERQRARIMAAVRGDAPQNACTSLVMRERCRFAEHVVQRRSLGCTVHMSILANQRFEIQQFRPAC